MRRRDFVALIAGTAKRLGRFCEVAPKASRYFALVNPTSVLAAPFVNDLRAAAASLGITIEELRASTDAEIDAASASLPQAAVNAMVFGPEPFCYIRRAQIAAGQLLRQTQVAR